MDTTAVPGTAAPDVTAGTSRGLSRLPMRAGTASIAASRALRGPRATTLLSGVYARIRSVAAADPDRIAVSENGRAVSYRQLCRRVGALRTALRAAGCGPGDRVGVVGPRGTDTIAAFLATETLGAAYLPVDTSWPTDRVAQMLERAAARCVVVHGADRAATSAGVRAAVRGVELASVPVVRAPGEEAVGELDTGPDTRPVDPNEPRYVIHTSGTTARPKGAVVVHSGLLNHLSSMVAELGLGPSDTVAFSAPPSYVISVWQMLAVLLVGGRVAVIDEADTLFGRRLAASVIRAGVTVLELVPAMIGWLVEERRRRPQLTGMPRLRCVLSTGEKLSPALAGEFLQSFPTVEFLNAYGCSECSDDVSLHRVGPADLVTSRVPAGRPLPNVALYLLVDEHGVWRAAEPGEPGELWVGGPGVGAGYLNEPRLTGTAFYLDEFDPESPTGRIYRTGDLAVFADRLVCCLGRADRQVKVGGVRIELGEVESVIGGVSGVVGCAVVRQSEGGDSWLVAHVVAAPHVTTAQLQAEARARLPRGMVPRDWVRVAELPRTGSGKVDYQRLQAVPSR